MVIAMYGRTYRLFQHVRFFAVVVLAITAGPVPADEFETARQQLVQEKQY